MPLSAKARWCSARLSRAQFIARWIQVELERVGVDTAQGCTMRSAGWNLRGQEGARPTERNSHALVWAGDAGCGYGAIARSRALVGGHPPATKDDCRGWPACCGLRPGRTNGG
jgi:hypothetical protein